MMQRRTRRLRQRIRDSFRAERGSVSPMIFVLLPALVALIGLSYDGGQVFAARREANNVASAAARAGANVVTEESLLHGLPELASQAPGVARTFAAGQGMDTAAARTIGAHIIEVDVSDTYDTIFLSIIGIDSLTVEGNARAVVRSAVENDDG